MKSLNKKAKAPKTNYMFFTILGVVFFTILVMVLFTKVTGEGKALPYVQDQSEPQPTPRQTSTITPGWLHTHLTEKQKHAVLGSLISLALADGEFHPLEEVSILATAELLGYYSVINPISSTEMMSFIKNTSMDDICDILDSFDEDLKDWYIMRVRELIQADGRVTNEEISSMGGIFTLMSLTPERVENTIIKTNALMTRLGR